MDGFDAMESYVSTVTDVDVPSLALTVSIDPKATDRLSRVALLAVVMIELRWWSWCPAESPPLDELVSSLVPPLAPVILRFGATLGSGR